jgi:hypothetical protein
MQFSTPQAVYNKTDAKDEKTKSCLWKMKIFLFGKLEMFN